MFSYIFVFSFAGSLASAGVMILLHRLARKRTTLIGISVLGALASTGIQLFLARLIIIGEGALLIAPPFLSVGLVTSIVLGIFAVRFTSVSRWYRGLLEAEEGA
jgi:heptaprenyl diphosphate synthase